MNINQPCFITITSTTIRASVLSRDRLRDDVQRACLRPEEDDSSSAFEINTRMHVHNLLHIRFSQLWMSTAWLYLTLLPYLLLHYDVGFCDDKAIARTFFSLSLLKQLL
jgi:hypothetical protein